MPSASFKDLLNGLHLHERRFIPDIFWYILEIPLSCFGQDHLFLFPPGMLRGASFFL
jgi:hypothetical protein